MAEPGKAPGWIYPAFGCVFILVAAFALFYALVTGGI